MQPFIDKFLKSKLFLLKTLSGGVWWLRPANQYQIHCQIHYQIQYQSQYQIQYKIQCQIQYQIRLWCPSLAVIGYRGVCQQIGYVDAINFNFCSRFLAYHSSYWILPHYTYSYTDNLNFSIYFIIRGFLLYSKFRYSWIFQLV